MPLLRLLLFCFAIVAVAAQPSRAAPVCPMPALEVHAVQPGAGCDHENAPRSHRNCPGPMACCAPMAVRAAGPALVLPQVWRVLRPRRPATERDPEDAAPRHLLRPPRSA